MTTHAAGLVIKTKGFDIDHH